MLKFKHEFIRKGQTRITKMFKRIWRIIMKESMLEYKGYHTVVRYNATDGTLRGIIEGINDYVDFQTTCIADVEKEFHCAVDDYLIFCEEVEKKTEKEYKGTFNVRIKPALHRKLALRALENGDTLNRAVEKQFLCIYLIILQLI